MQTEQIVALLTAERDRMSRAIEALQAPMKRARRSSRAANATSFDTAFDNAFWLAGDGSPLLVAGAKHSNSYIAEMANLLGTLPQLTLDVNYDLKGAVLPEV